MASQASDMAHVTDHRIGEAFGVVVYFGRFSGPCLTNRTGCQHQCFSADAGTDALKQLEQVTCSRRVRQAFPACGLVYDQLQRKPLQHGHNAAQLFLTVAAQVSFAEASRSAAIAIMCPNFAGRCRQVEQCLDLSPSSRTVCMDSMVLKQSMSQQA